MELEKMSIVEEEIEVPSSIGEVKRELKQEEAKTLVFLEGLDRDMLKTFVAQYEDDIDDGIPINIDLVPDELKNMVETLQSAQERITELNDALILNKIEEDGATDVEEALEYAGLPSNTA